MDKALVLKAEIRQGLGSKDAIKLRKQGQIPAVVYGHKKEPVSIALDAKSFTEGLHRGRRLVLTCELEHRVPRHLHVQMIPFYARCPQCGSYRRKWTWMPAPLWLDGWDWLIWGARAAGRCLAGLGRLL